jgi:hypothetical protein
MGEAPTLNRPTTLPAGHSLYRDLVATCLPCAPHVIFRGAPFAGALPPVPIEVVDLTIGMDMEAQMRRFAAERGIHGAALYAVPVSGMVIV